MSQLQPCIGNHQEVLRQTLHLEQIQNFVRSQKRWKTWHAKASKAMGGGILGVDMMEDEEKGLVVHEVNNTVEFKGLARVAKRNIPKEMIEFALNYVRK